MTFNIIGNCAPIINCFKKEDNKKIYERAEKYNIMILPIEKGHEINDLFPKNNHVELWTTLVIGKNKNYIVSNINNIELGINKESDLLNNLGNNIMPEEFFEFLDSVWDKTLHGPHGEALQFFIIIKSVTYLCNTYPLLNNNKIVTGGIMFIRQIYNLPWNSLKNTENT